MKDAFKKWLAIFMSVSMIATSGIFPGSSLLAAGEDPYSDTQTTEVQADPATNETETTVAVDEGKAEETPAATAEAEATAAPEATAEAAATPEATSEAAAEPAAAPAPEKKPVKTAYSAKNDGVYVVAVLTDPTAVSDDAELTVKAITEGDAYDNYIAALDKNDPSMKHTPENTALYDVAFMLDGKEVEPASGDVHVDFTFVKDQLTEDLGAEKKDDVKVQHLTLSDDAKEKADTTTEAAAKADVEDIKVEEVTPTNVSLNGNEKVTLKTDSFSVFAIYGNNGSGDGKVAFATKEATGFSTTPITTLLGNALNYGIVADTWDFNGGDAETSMAVTTLNNKGSQNGSNDSKSEGANAQYWIVGQVNGNNLQVKGYDAFVTTTSDVIANGKIYNGGNPKINFTVDTFDNIKATVDSMISSVKKQSNILGSQDSLNATKYSEIQNTDQNTKNNGAHMTIDFTDLPDNKTYCIDVDQWADLQNILAQTGGLIINKLEGQTVVFNFKSAKAYNVGKYEINNTADGKTTNYGSDSLANMTTADADVIEKIIFNFTDKAQVTLNNTAGVFLAPSGNITCGSTCGGWAVSNAMATGDEWHYVYDRVYKPDQKGLHAVKQIDGAAATVSGFKFNLSQKSAEGWTSVETAENDGSAVKFSDIVYDENNCPNQVNEFIYRIEESGDVSEIDGKKYNLDTTKFYAKVTVTKATVGNTTTFTASEPAYYSDEECTKALAGTPTFNNTSVKGKLTYTKTIQGGADVPENLKFTVTDASGKIIDDTNYSNLGPSHSKTIEVDPGTYTVTESNADVDGYNLTTTYKVNGIDKQDTTVTVNANDNVNVELVNTYVKKTASATIKVNKQLVKYDSEGNPVNVALPLVVNGSNVQFKFELLDKDKYSFNPQKFATTDGTSPATFGELTYTQPGNYNYFIKEVEPVGTVKHVKYGITYSTELIPVTVAVNKDYEAAVSYNGDSAVPTVTNTYNATGTLTFHGTKSITGDREKINDKEVFNFTIWEITEEHPDGVAVGHGQSDKNGTITFDTLNYDLNTLGTHHYQITEDDVNEPGMSKDSKVYKVDATVSDEKHNGTLSVATTGANPAELNFVNTFTKGGITLTATKQLSNTNKPLKAGQFEFELLDSENNRVGGTKFNDAQGGVTFDEIKYDEPGTYTYTIKEVIPADEDKLPGYTYDPTPVSVTVNVDSKLQATASYQKNGKDVNGAAFVNDYSATGHIDLAGTKTFKNGTLTDGLFKFTVTDVTDENKPVVIQNDVSNTGRNINFQPITYQFDKDHNDLGTHTYKVAETALGQDGIVYDRQVYTFTTTVKDHGNGTLDITHTGTPDALNFTNELKKGSAILEVSKTLTGKNLTDGEFEFALTDSAGNVIETKKNDSEGKVRFSEIDYDQKGTYTYKIHEVNDNQGGITYDRHEVTATVNVTKNKDGSLSASTSYEGSTEFKNTYNAAGSLTLSGTKSYNRDLVDGQFEFTVTDITDSDNPVIKQTVTNDKDGNIRFQPLTYGINDAGKTFTYVVKEATQSSVSQDGKSKINADKKTYQFSVHVKDNGDGTLIPEITDGTPSALTFTNTYSSDAQTDLEVRKLVNNKQPGKDIFKFELVDKNEGTDNYGKVLSTAESGEDGVVRFQPRVYGPEARLGDYYYVIKEVNDNKSGFTYDSHEVKVTVTVSEDADGTRHAVPKYTEGNTTFSNTYAASGSVTLSGKKYFENMDAGQYDFVITREDELGNKQETTVTNNLDGTINYPTLNYTLDDVGKTYTYTVSEKAPGTGITSTPALYTFTVKVEDQLPHDGHLKITTTGKTTGLDFTNTYNASGDVVLHAHKTLENLDLKKAGPFEFVLSGAGIEDQTKTANADGDVTFDAISYTLDDAGKKFTYYINEVVPEDAVGGVKDGITYDKHTATVTVEVADEGNGHLTATPVYSDGNAASFTNTYNSSASIGFSGTKSYNKLPYNDSDNKPFSFELVDVTNEPHVTKETVSSDAEGKFTFTDIAYTQADEGTHKYEVREVNDGRKGVTYDSTVYKFTVTVKDDGEGNLTAKADKDTKAIKFTNTYNATGYVQFAGKKTFEGKTLEGGDFTYTVKEGDTEIQTVTNKSDGTIEYEPINYTFDDVGDHTYTVTENKTDKKGVTVDSKSYTVKVNVGDNGDGTLSVTKLAGSADYENLDFKNTYNANGEVQLGATKVLDHKTLVAGQFSFQLKDKDGNVLQTKSNAADGSVTFDKIKYTAAGDYAYTINEVVPGDAKNNVKDGITYDATVRNVTVHVTDDGEGSLIPMAEYEGGSALFKNTYAAKGTVQFAGTKSFNKALSGNDFTFTVKEGNEVVQTVSNKADGTIEYAPINYELKDVGTHTYTVTENATDKKGVAKNTQSYTVTVEVTDKGDGTLSVDPSNNYQSLDFTNTYAATGSVQFAGTKSFNRNLIGGDFSFVVKEGNNIIQTATNAADGSITFAPITYNFGDVGTHTYTVTEAATDKKGVTVDPKSYTVTVNVEDNGDGTLNVTKSNNAVQLDFTNTYNANGEVQLGATKVLDHKTLEAGMFSFQLKDQDGNVLQTKSNAADGSVTFDKIKYTAAGDYAYTINEVVPGDAKNNVKDGITYDSTARNVTVHVTDDGEGSLIPTAEYEGGKAEFTNTYAAAGSVQFAGTKSFNKALTGNDFTFTVKEGDKVVQTVSNKADGTIAYEPISYELKDVGTHTYTVTENATDKKGVAIDTNSYTVTVEVTDKGDGTLSVDPSDNYQSLSFTNTYSADGSVVLSASKTLNDKPAEAGMFEFELDDEDGKKIETVKNSDGGVVTFSALKYTEAGTYHYSIHEVVPEGVDDKNTLKGITYDGHIVNVTVEVTDDGKGTLTPTASYDDVDGKAVFANKYAAAGSVSFTGTKYMEGRKLSADDQYHFGIVDENGIVVKEAVNDADGKIKFDDIEYTLDDVGDHTYSIKELSQDGDGVTADTTIYTAVVSVKDNGDGTLDVQKTITKDGEAVDELKFVNKYHAAAAAAMFRGRKRLTNGTMKAGQFRFELVDKDTGKVIDTATNDENGNYVFARQKYDAEGTHHYIVREVNAGRTVDGVTYDGESSEITVVVTDDLNGKYVATVTGGVADITNKQLTSLSVEKKWAGETAGTEYRPDAVTVRLIKHQGESAEEVASAVLSEDNSWAYKFDNLPAGDGITYSITEDKTPYYQADVAYNSDHTEATLTNTFVHPNVDISAKKTLVGHTLYSGEFTFELTPNSNPDKTYRTVNDSEGNIVFTDLPYDAAGYTIREVASDDTHITYDTNSYVVKIDSDSDTQDVVPEFRNQYHPIVLRIQKRSKDEPHDPLYHATYALYQVNDNGQDIKVEEQISDINGYMYFSNITVGSTYYFKEVAAPEGHEVDPYPESRFKVEWVDGTSDTPEQAIRITSYNDDGTVNEDQTKNFTVSNSADAAPVTIGEDTEDLSSYEYQYEDDEITAAAKTEVADAFGAGVKPELKVTRLAEDSDEYKKAQTAMETAIGEADSLALYDITFMADGKEVEPVNGDVTVTIQPKNAIGLNGNSAQDVKIIHISDKDDKTEISSVGGSLAVNEEGIAEVSVTSDSYSIYGLVVPGETTALNNNLMLTAAGVADFVSKLNIAKIDTAGKYVKGAKMQIKERSTDKVVAEWDTAEEPMAFARYLMNGESLNVDTEYVLHEVSAPEGYNLADDILFSINKYDSSINVYKFDDNGNLVYDKEASDAWVSTKTLTMIDVPVKEEVKEIRHEIEEKRVEYRKAPDTADNSSAIGMFAIFAAAVVAIAALLILRKRAK